MLWSLDPLAVAGGRWGNKEREGKGEGEKGKGPQKFSKVGAYEYWHHNSITSAGHYGTVSSTGDMPWEIGRFEARLYLATFMVMVFAQNQWEHFGNSRGGPSDYCT